MRTRKIITILVSLAITMSALSFATVASASPGHGHDDAKQTIKKKTKKAKRTPKSAASQTSALAGTLGTPEAPRDIAISMTDSLRFDPATIAVTEGETIRFVVDNPTAAPHDFTLGDLEAQEHHAEEMAMGEGHGDDADAAAAEGGLPGPVTLEPGESAELITTFDDAGERLIGCHVAGHWEAGMRGSIMVLPADLA